MESDRWCARCGESKPISAFHLSSRGDGRQSWCKVCRRDYDAAYHQRVKIRRRAQARARQRRFVAWYRELKAGRPCTDCGGVFHPAAMHWDHLPGSEKIGDLGDLVRRGNRGQVLAEIEKCELVCANCHAVRTVMRQRGVAQPG